MSVLTVRNPANGATIGELPQDDAQSIASKYGAARAAQPAWAARPLQARIGILRSFRDALAADVERLAGVLTSETGKPIRQSKNEVNGLLGRIDFFLAESTRALREERVHADAKQNMDEEMSHEPLGVIANISAWNYPYFVGSNVFVPALLAGNAVLYKPSEFATLTGTAHRGDAARGRRPAATSSSGRVGDGATGAALSRQPVDGVFFTGSYATGARIAAAASQRMIKVQLELGGKDPVYVRDDVDVKAAAAASPTARSTTPDSPAARSSASTCTNRSTTRSSTRSSRRSRASRWAIRWTSRPTSAPITRAPQLDVLEAGRRREEERREAPHRRRVARGKGNWFEPTVFADVDHSMAVMRDESFGPIIGIQAVADDEAAVDLMNDTDYGLTAGVYTTDPSARRRSSRRSMPAASTGTAAIASARGCRGRASAIRASASRCPPTASRRSRGRRRGT